MSNKPDISPEARALQQINNELHKKYKPVSGYSEIAELVQGEIDAVVLEWQQANDMVGATAEELQPRWYEVLKYVHGRALRQEAITTLVVLSRQYGIHQVVAIMDGMRIQFYGFDVITEEPDLQINWRIIDNWLEIFATP